jgi:hypothetical protein
MSKREINEKFYKKSLMITLVKASNVSRFKKHATDQKEESTSPSTTQQQHASKLTPGFESGRKLQRSNVDYNSINNLESFGFLDKQFDAKPSNTSSIQTANIQSDPPIQEKSECKDPSSAADVKNKPDENSKRTLENSSNESEGSSVKKPKMNDEYEDYSDYDEEDEEKSLVIDYNDEHKAEPSKPSKLAIESETKPSSVYDENVPKSPPGISIEGETSFCCIFFILM